MEESRSSLEFTPSMLRRVTDPTTLPFQTTESLPPPDTMIGQERARAAMRLALETPDGRYNLFVAGRPGSGRTEATLAQVNAMARQLHPKHDWVYVYNFDLPEEPQALELAAGRGRSFAHDVEKFVTAYRRELKRAFTSDVYEQRSEEVVAAPLARRGQLLETLGEQALALGFSLRGTPSGFVIVPLSPAAEGVEPTPMTEEAFSALPKDQQRAIEERHAKVEAAINAALPAVRAAEDEARGLIRALDREVATTAGYHLSELIIASYSDCPEIVDYLHKLQADIVAHARVLFASVLGVPTSQPEEPVSEPSASGNEPSEMDGVPMDESMRPSPALRSLLRRYSVNVMVSRSPEETAPVVVETNPTYANLIGRIDIGVRDNLSFTDHMMLRPGDMHKAVGGFLILQARELALQPHSWDAVKRLVRFGRIELENGSQSFSNTPGATIRPQPIRADVKVILIGSHDTFVELSQLDPEFRQNFKVRADFEYDMPRDATAEQAYAAVAGDAARTMGYPQFTSEAVALLIEEGSRWAQDQERVSTQLEEVHDLSVEASYFARRAGEPLTRRQHVAEAISARRRRLSLIPDREQEEILRHAVLISTEGTAVGQINGLYVSDFLGFEYGMPARITATVSPGLAGVVTVDREADLSGRLHTKGVLVLAGYLAGNFAEDFPLSLSASLSFEQEYLGVDGDSASSAELYALLSALADVPIRQHLAVTGSVNQRGEVQAIGGATHKIEGFFRICKQRGLTGNQGVIIPSVNLRNVMLREEVVEAVRDGQFHVYGVNSIEEGIQLLTGLPFGKKNRDGQYLEGTIASRVLRRLKSYSALVQWYGLPRGERGNG